jgi:hypothetical protein
MTEYVTEISSPVADAPRELQVLHSPMREPEPLPECEPEAAA